MNKFQFLTVKHRGRGSKLMLHDQTDESADVFSQIQTNTSFIQMNSNELHK